MPWSSGWTFSSFSWHNFVCWWFLGMDLTFKDSPPILGKVAATCLDVCLESFSCWSWWLEATVFWRILRMSSFFIISFSFCNAPDLPAANQPQKHDSNHAWQLIPCFCSLMPYTSLPNIPLVKPFPGHFSASMSATVNFRRTWRSFWSRGIFLGQQAFSPWWCKTHLTVDADTGVLGDSSS